MVAWRMASRDAVNVWIAVYMMSNRRHGTVYTGVTSFLPGRIGQHKERAKKSFTREYGLDRLVWYETHELMTVAIQREKNIKKYPREWKVNLIEAENRFWDDLYPQLFI
jgi:putative endonuclease